MNPTKWDTFALPTVKWQHTLSNTALVYVFMQLHTEQSEKLVSDCAIDSFCLGPEFSLKLFIFLNRPSPAADHVKCLLSPLTAAAGSTGYLGRTCLSTKDNCTRERWCNRCYQDLFSDIPLCCSSAARSSQASPFPWQAPLRLCSHECKKHCQPRTPKLLSARYNKPPANTSLFLIWRWSEHHRCL